MEGLGLAEPVAVTLVRRGYRTVAEARGFLEAGDEHDPFEFDSMQEVVERIRKAIDDGLMVTVHGDYDCDGVCSTAILVRALRELGARCDWYIPDRLADGYGLTMDGVQRLASRGTGLLLTTDCGIGCSNEVAAARSAGMEVIVTDHHQPGTELPECLIVHPVVSGYPCRELCATGVAYKLSPPSWGNSGPPTTSTSLRWPRSPTWSPCEERTVPSCAPGWRRPEEQAGQGSGPFARRPGSLPSGSTRATSPSALARVSTPRAACIGLTPGSS